MAQVSLWVQQDLFAALRRTNEDESLRTTDPNGGVSVRPMKRLIGTRLRGYCVKQSLGAPALGAPTAAPVAGGPAAVPAGVSGAVDNFGYYPSGISGAPTLTKRATNPQYDVVHYEFTIVINPAALNKFYYNLMTGGHMHTVLEQVISGRPRTEQASAGTGLPAGSARTADMYYYGTDGVVEVTVVAEMLLLADWTRGLPGPAGADGKPTFMYPPLMPAEFLRELGLRDKTLLREADNLLLAPPAPGEAGGSAMPPR